MEFPIQTQKVRIEQLSMKFLLKHYSGLIYLLILSGKLQIILSLLSLSNGPLGFYNRQTLLYSILLQ